LLLLQIARNTDIRIGLYAITGADDFPLARLTYKTLACDDQSVSDAKENISKTFFTCSEKDPYINCNTVK